MTHVMAVLDEATHSTYRSGMTGSVDLDTSYRVSSALPRMSESCPSEDAAVGSVVPLQQDENHDLTDVRLEIVAALKAQIESGTYHVPAADLANRIISSLTR